ncbi:MAG: hypothetical protein DRP15_00890 [Candidatus Aenigmatarchaeota archaeon]|nr:MAG: hypothetical protein DRP15_00890 [Candidatus Aenigmarchaeota archaeon]
MTCYCLGTNNNYCYLGQVASHSLNTVTFNITVNDSTPLGVYFLSVNVSYTNPGNEQKFWPEQEQQQLRVSEFGILEAVIHSNYSELDRGVLYNLTGFANNTNNQQALNVNLTWNLPEGWVNTSGSLTTSTPSLDPDNIFWNNITINITLAASLG